MITEFQKGQKVACKLDREVRGVISHIDKRHSPYIVYVELHNLVYVWMTSPVAAFLGWQLEEIESLDEY